MIEAGFEGIRKSVTRRQNTVGQYIVTRPIMDLYERTAQRLGARMSRQWWEQDGTDLDKVKGRAAEITTTDSESEGEVESEEGWGRSSDQVERSGSERSEYPWRTTSQTGRTLKLFTT